MGSASVPQQPAFWKGHCLWICSLGTGYEPERAQILDEGGRADGEARRLDQPTRLDLQGDDHLVVAGIEYLYDEDRGRLAPFSARIEYRLKESAKGVLLEEVPGSYCAWGGG